MKITSPEVMEIVEEFDSFTGTDLAESVEIESSQMLAATHLDSRNSGKEDFGSPANINIQNNIIVVAPWASSVPSFIEQFAVRTSQVIAPQRREVLHTIDLGRPKPKTYFRVHPDGAYSMEVMILESGGEQYIVSKSIQEELGPELTKKKLFLWITQDGNLGIWPIKVPKLGNSKGWIDPWNRSALKAAKLGMSAWITIRSNQNLKQYDAFQASWNIEPKLPTMDFGQIVMLAFENRILETMDDPVVKEVLGELYC
ncbi:MAG: hypothetical protein M1511_15860 [Deltaproteobacteria bacterium]|nr:hypothetical protein [Deltaproteobacteria bacterium]